jgi:hypothetical protein
MPPSRLLTFSEFLAQYQNELAFWLIDRELIDSSLTDLYEIEVRSFLENYF